MQFYERKKLSLYDLLWRLETHPFEVAVYSSLYLHLAIGERVFILESDDFRPVQIAAEFVRLEGKELVFSKRVLKAFENADLGDLLPEGIEQEEERFIEWLRTVEPDFMWKLPKRVAVTA